MLGNLQSEWARLFVDALVGAGVKHAVVSPGSRSTPFAWAVLEHPGLECHSVIDERSAGFFALGQAKVSGQPSLLLCTSGSAGAHYLPALIEARYTRTPLVVLTADRPFRRMKRGASQTIDQTHLFGSAVTEFFELGAADASQTSLLALQQTAVHAVWAAQRAGGGPVHVNARAEKPLEPRAAETPAEHDLARRVDALIERRSTRAVTARPTLRAVAVETLARAIERAERGLIVCGTVAVHERERVRWVSELARRTRFGVLAELQSQLGLHVGCHHLFRPLSSFAGLDRLLEDGPDFVLELGTPLVSRHYEPFCARLGRGRHVVSAHDFSDPTASAENIWQAEPLELVEALASVVAEPDAALEARRKRWLERLRDANLKTEAAIAGRLESEPFGEAHALRELARALPRRSLLFVGNSLPVRALNAFAEVSEREIATISQRGASGIDGLVAGAAGAASLGQQTTLVLGDVALAHDIGSLQLTRSSKLCIVVIDNEGGRIFEQLPWGLAEDASERQKYWVTPPGLDFEALGASLGIPHSRADTAVELERALGEAYRSGGPHLVRVVVPASSYRQVVDGIERELAGR